MSVEIQTMGEGGIFEIAAVVIDEVLEIQPFTDVEYEILSSARDILAEGSILEAATVATNSANTAAGLASEAASAANDAAGLANSATTSANTAAGLASEAASAANDAAGLANSATTSANTAAGLASEAASAANDAAGLANSATTSANTAAGAANSAATSATSAAGAANTAASSANSAASAANTAAATAASFVGTGPAGYYATLTALQAAYPTGDTGIYVELEYGHWYYWSGSAWTDGGLFQAPLAVVQTTGTSTTDVMSQKAVTDELALKVDKNSVKQTTGNSTTDVMSQKAVTDGISYINVDKLIPSETTYTLQTAINALWASFRDLCKKGTIITFHKGSSVWDIYQFKGTDLIQTESYWKNTANWLLRTRPVVFFVPATAGISGINSTLWANPNGCTIELEEGTYSGISALEFTNGGSIVCKDCVIIGKGVNTVISRNTGYNDLIAQAGSNNIIKNCNFAHSILRTTGKAILSQCVINGKFTDDTMKSCHDIKIAAPDSTEQAKLNSDIVAGSTDAQTAIQTAINSLPNGGTIFLASGTYNLSAYINLDGKSNIAIKGSGYNTYLNRSGGYAIWGETASNCCISDLRYTVVNVSNTTYQYNVWNGGDYIDYAPNNMVTLKVPSSKGIAGINTAINLIKNTGGKITLEEGTYTGTVGIDLLGSNITIEGQGAKTIINRTNSSLELMGDSVSSRNNVVRNLKLTHSFKQSGDYPTQRYRLEDCIVNGEIINQCDTSNVVFNIGLSYFYKNISVPYAVVSSTAWVYNNRFEFHIHGHIVETGEVLMDKPVSLVGHNALVEFTGPVGARAWFYHIGSPYVQNMLSWWPVVVKDIHFIKTGCFNYWNDACVSVTGSDWKFINCVFENASSSPSPFDNSTQSVGDEDHNGCRRHGIAITIPFTTECRTEFHNCIGIASPYGFQSCRGWYFMTGVPKLYDCVGIGGGIGEFGHGIVCHEASDATLFNFRGYAGEHSYRQAAGIRYQASGKNSLFNCIGYGSKGTQRKSEGVPYSALHQRCVEVGITDESFFYDGTDVDYDGLTIKTVDDGYNASRLLLGNAIQLSDITITELGGVSEEGFGISLWSHNGRPIIENCKGYAGHGTNSEGIRIQDYSEPLIRGGYYGPEYQNFIQDIIKDNNGYCIFSVPTNVISQYTPYILKNVGITIRGGNYMTRHLKLHLETNESTPQVIIDGYDMYNKTSIGLPTIERIEIPAGVGLKAYITENDVIVTDYTDAYFYLMITCVANPSGAKGCSIRESAKPQIVGATMEHEAVGLGIYTTSTDYLVDKCMIESDGDAIATDKDNLRVFDSAIRGTVDSGITFASKTAINGSSNYSK